MSSQINQFMQHYCDAWNQLDGQVIANHYKDNATIIDGDGTAQYSSDALLIKFESNCQQLANMKFIRTEFELCNINEAALTIEVVWLVEFQEQSINFGMTYQLCHEKSNLKIEHAALIQ